ncbi:MAG: hypothetical protein FJ313_07250, partial [Gemmatimonadetes bacterium]|nr:hypothetical protein [Gemmatimonadota bacterium]
CGQLPNLVRAEVLGLSDEQLDWTSRRWEWSRWSIRRQVSHMASLIYMWLLGRWGPRLFPEGLGIAAPDYQVLISIEHGPWLDERLFRRMPDIERALRAAAYLAIQILRRETAGSLRKRTLTLELEPEWELLHQAHPSGIRPATEPGKWEVTLEATFRHLHFECIAHVYNIQRLKRAQGLIAVCELPEDGYITLPGWDRSEPEPPPTP